MIADFVKNREREFLPMEIQKGIKLHRAIDTFTDAHPVVHQAKRFFSPMVRLYAGAFVDVSFDYFLANDVGVKTFAKFLNMLMKNRVSFSWTNLTLLQKQEMTNMN
jgi:acyl carrier protein phosphodiesterase